LDLIKMLAAGEYLTGQLATWGEGDHNGTPAADCTFTNPPVGNGLFDQQDITAMLNTGLNLEPPYSALQRAEPVCVPEPSSNTLLGLAMLGVLFVR
jgi:hypothetical protein